MGGLPRGVLAALLLTLALAALLVTDALPLLRGGEVFNWQWPYVPAWVAQPARVLLLTGAVALYGLAAGWSLRRPTARLALLIAFVGSALLPYGVVWLRHSDPLLELFRRTISGVTTGPHLLAARIDWQNPAEWQDWVAVMDEYHDLSVHAGQSPPGLVLFYAGLNQLLAWSPPLAQTLYTALLPEQCHNSNLLNYTPAEWASAWFGMLMPLWAALTVFPLYRLGRSLVAEPAGRGAALLWALFPAVAMMSPSWNVLYPAVCMVAFGLLRRGLPRPSGAGYFSVAGLLTGALIFANLSVVPLALLFGFYTLLHYMAHERGRRPWLRPVRVGLWYGAGVLLLPGLYLLLTGTSPLAILARAFDTHLDLDRPYGPWMWMHFWEWALFGCLPAVLVWLAGLRRSWPWSGSGSWSGRSPGSGSGAAVLPAALALTLLVMLVSNTARGETGRVWLFFAPFAVLCAGLCLRQAAAPAVTAWRGLLLAQAALLLALATTWDVMAAPDLRPTPPAPAAHAGVIPAQVQFGQTGDSQVWQPAATRYPATCWRPGDIVGDTVTLALPPAAAAGDWWLSLSAFAAVTAPLDRLPVTLPDGTVDTQTGLGPVPVAR
ncbi:MAG: hypothetical protein MUE40_11255 [Anaerolineae bacterium]|nr:hypothetical protein [Anaerolineae bacterium]